MELFVNRINLSSSNCITLEEVATRIEFSSLNIGGHLFPNILQESGCDAKFNCDANITCDCNAQCDGNTCDWNIL